MSTARRLEGAHRLTAITAADHCCSHCGFSETGLVAFEPADAAPGKLAKVLCEECLPTVAPEIAQPGSYRLAWAPDVPKTLMPHLARLAAWLVYAKDDDAFEELDRLLLEGKLPAVQGDRGEAASGGVGKSIFEALKRRIELFEEIFGGADEQALERGLEALRGGPFLTSEAIRVVPVKFDMERVTGWAAFGTFQDVVEGQI